MFLTNVLLKRVKTKNILVRVKSVCSEHTAAIIRERSGEKLEVLRFDPLVQMESVYKEVGKIRSTKIPLASQRFRRSDPTIGALASNDAKS